jgi:hypothetical protein
MMTESEALKVATHRHYKGGLYLWIAEAKHSETGELMVVYEHVWPHKQALWVRPATLFYGRIRDGVQARFEAIASFPAGSTPDTSHIMAMAIDAVKQHGFDTAKEIAALISATALVSLHHKLLLDRVKQLEAQANILCPECKGAGRVKMQMTTDAGEFYEWHTCPACNGVGILRGTGVH